MRIVIFTDYDNTATLIEATLTEVGKRPGSEVVAVCTSASRLLRPRRVLSSSRRMLGAVARGHRPRRSGRVSTLCRRWGVPLLMVPDGDPNAPVFLDDMRSRWHPDLALSYWSTAIFGADWLDAFDHAVNFHDSRLPDHRGLGATMMEMYDGLESGGFTFHHIDRGIDTGNVLVDGTVPTSGLVLMDLVEAKFVAAGRRLGDLLDLVEAGDPGREQEDGGSYTSARMLDELTTIDDPAALGRAELQRRIDAFGSVLLPLPGGPGPATRLARRRGLRWPRARMADGSVTVSRVAGLPAAGYLIGRAIRGGFRRR